MFQQLDAKSLIISWADERKREIDRLARRQVVRMADELAWTFEAKPGESVANSDGVECTNVESCGRLVVKGYGEYEGLAVTIRFVYQCNWEEFPSSIGGETVFGARVTFVASTCTAVSGAKGAGGGGEGEKKELLVFQGEASPTGTVYKHRVRLDSTMLESLRQVLLPAVDSRMDVLDLILSVSIPFVERNGLATEAGGEVRSWKPPFALRHVLLWQATCVVWPEREIDDFRII